LGEVAFTEKATSFHPSFFNLLCGGIDCRSAANYAEAVALE
jgi:hypothetical protein